MNSEYQKSIRVTSSRVDFFRYVQEVSECRSDIRNENSDESLVMNRGNANEARQSPMKTARESKTSALCRVHHEVECFCNTHMRLKGPVLVGVSGGADSVALLCVLGEKVHGRPLVIVHARHDLRESAIDDENFVIDLAKRMGFPVHTRNLFVRYDDNVKADGLEATARRLRYEFFEDVAQRLGARQVAVGHTADDQAETILLRAFRGTGLHGLGGMVPSRALSSEIALVRPLLTISRQEARKFLDEIGQPWREDASNADTAFARNFLRHEILRPVIEGPFPGASQSLVRLGAQASKSASALSSAAEHLIELYTSATADGIVVQCNAMSALDQHLLAEIFVVIWKQQQWPARDMTARHFSQLASIVNRAQELCVAKYCSADFPGQIRTVLAMNTHTTRCTLTLKRLS